jgi:hypothetical protein
MACETVLGQYLLHLAKLDRLIAFDVGDWCGVFVVRLDSMRRREVDESNENSDT